jgi:hypothetical protein
MTPSQTYEDLLAIAKSNPEAVDFRELRLAYARSPQYHPYSTERWPDRPLRELLDEKDTEMAIKAINRRLATYYLDIHAHLAAAYVYRRVGDEARSAHHRKCAKGLLDSIFESGDGRTYETAFVVIDVSEEYAVLDVLGLQLAVQSLHEHEGHHFDLLECRDPKTDKSAELYFNIDMCVTWLDGLVDGLSSSEVEALLDGVMPPKRRKWWQFWK